MCGEGGNRERSNALSPALARACKTGWNWKERGIPRVRTKQSLGFNSSALLSQSLIRLSSRSFLSQYCLEKPVFIWAQNQKLGSLQGAGKFHTQCIPAFSCRAPSLAFPFLFVALVPLVVRCSVPKSISQADLPDPEPPIWRCHVSEICTRLGNHTA